MSVDQATVRRIARLARIRISDNEVPKLESELNHILGWIEMMDEVDTDNVHPGDESIVQNLLGRFTTCQRFPYLEGNLFLDAVIGD